MSTLLIPVLRGTLPGFPTAVEPTLLETLTLILFIPAGIAILIMALGMGRRWLAQDAAVKPVEVPEGHAEILPSTEQLEARRALVHQAALHNEGRPDRPTRPVKNDPDTLHP